MKGRSISSDTRVFKIGVLGVASLEAKTNKSSLMGLEAGLVLLTRIVGRAGFANVLALLAALYISIVNAQETVLGKKPEIDL
eukprot:1158562-Pelagomonas_calceolata.AAC.14